MPTFTKLKLYPRQVYIHNLSGLWSQRLSQKDRIVYKFDDRYIYIFAIDGHYDQF
ncbi:type II toxin-antitoxin system YoeB family toxin [Geminocystis herdmanii]|uniref:type II toxin-antitoxin system YoeB family toxin n=1 Tax=Geminocystis herdmanii TaxID=669359 RepID=UPI0003454A99